MCGCVLVCVSVSNSSCLLVSAENLTVFVINIFAGFSNVSLTKVFTFTRQTKVLVWKGVCSRMCVTVCVCALSVSVVQKSH